MPLTTAAMQPQTYMIESFAHCCKTPEQRETYTLQTECETKEQFETHEQSGDKSET
jgi:hypothetical protein